MTEDGLAALDFDVEWTCELGSRGDGHSERAVASFGFCCVTRECETHPSGPARQLLVVCERCLRLVCLKGLDCLRCGEFYRMGGWLWLKATRIDRFVSGSKPLEPGSHEP